MNGNLLEINNKRFDIDMKRANSCMEIAMMEAAINIEEGEYKCMLESGTDSDLDYVLEEAKEGFIGKVKAAIDKIIEAVKTGDTSQIMLFSCLTLVSGLVLLIIAMMSMKRRRNEKGV